jgi:saccharopine dehydrogenase-like NADP-dependent oxidoreductase
MGAGKIGTLIGYLLAQSQDYTLTIVDRDLSQFKATKLAQQSAVTGHELALNDHAALTQLISIAQIEAVISCLPFSCNVQLAQLAKAHQLHYFDLTEDTQVSAEIEQLAYNSSKAYVPQCGLAPGFISIAAQHLIQQFDSVEAIKLRAGALPRSPCNALKYALTWSVEGLINEYGNACHAIIEGQDTLLRPLEGLETVQIDGLLYEAFNTSGGLGSLAQTYAQKVNTLDYKTLRYPGHCEKMRFLMHDLQLNQNRQCLATLLEKTLGHTVEDVVIIYVAVTGYVQQRLTEKFYVKKIYPQRLFEQTWSAIQIATASSLCAVVDILLAAPQAYSGMILQESFALPNILNNRFGQYYQ